MRRDVSPEITEYFFYSRLGIVCLGLPRVMKSDLIPILVWVGNLSKQVSHCAPRCRLYGCILYRIGLFAVSCLCGANQIEISPSDSEL